MKNTSIYILVFTILFFSGCYQQDAMLKINTYPQGAQILSLQTNKIIGIAPKQGKIPAKIINQGNKSIKCRVLKGLQARWVSGATSSIRNIKICLGQVNSFTITRPKYPNLDADIQYEQIIENRAIEKKKLKILKSQAASTAANARANARKAELQQQYNSNQEYYNQQRNLSLQNLNNYIKYGY